MAWRQKEYWIALSLILVAAVYAHLLRYDSVWPDEPIRLDALPRQVGGWLSQDFVFERNVLDVLKADQTLSRRYVNEAGEEIWLFVGYWQNQKYGAQPHSPLHCLPGSGWNFSSRETISFAAAGLGMTASRAGAENSESTLAVISNGSERELALYWYQMRSGSTGNEIDVKIELARNALLRNPTDVAFVRLTSPLAGHSEADVLKMLQAFWSQLAGLSSP